MEGPGLEKIGLTGKSASDLEAMRAILGATDDHLVLFDSELRVIMVNRAFARFFRLNADALAGVSIAELFEPRIGSARTLRLQNEIAAVAANGGPSEELEFETSGELFDITFFAVRECDALSYILMSAHNVTVRRRLETELATRLRIEESLTAMVFSADPRFTVQYMNAAGYDLTGFKPEDVEYGRVKAVHLFDSPLLQQTVFDALANKGVWHGSSLLVCRDGTKLPVSADLFAIRDGSGTCAGYGGVLTDISEIVAAKEEAEAANLAKTQFLTHMSHQLRAPMDAIINMSRRSQNPALRPDQVERYLSRIDASGMRLLDLIDDMLDVSQLESGSLQLENKPIDPAFLVRGAIESVSGPSSSKRQEIGFTIDGDVPGTFSGDGRRTGQVLSTLMSSAVRFAPEEARISLSVERESVRAQSAVMRFTVRVTGTGGESALMARFMQGIERSVGSASHYFGGSGLKLLIAKYLAQLMGGGISSYTEPKGGSAFIFTGRFFIAAGPPSPDQLKRPVGVPDFTGRRVLVAEDVALNAEILAAVLEPTGVSMELAGNGREAAEAVKALPGRFDLILMDIQMPEMDGYQATQVIRSDPDPEVAAIPILAMTANVFKEDIDRCIEVGMDGHLSKPIDEK